MDRSTPAWRRAVGGALALSILGGWVTLHVWGVFFWRWSPLSSALAAPVVLAETWLGSGLFIVAHDAMHGSLFPGRPGWNSLAGRAMVGIYAGFDYGKLAAHHRAHHRTPGAADDPDFHADDPHAFWRWYAQFFRTYFGGWELARLAAAVGVYLLVFKASPLNMAVFWGAPAILSSLQLFTFGTWLPHRHGGAGFADGHNARTLRGGWWVTLLTCFHFGLHHEHHLQPQEPWWRLPSVRRARAD